MNPICISNIAWGEWDDASVFSLLRENGVVAQEVAPSKIWKDLKSVSAEDIAAKSRLFRDEGFAVPAFQAILFGHPEWNLFAAPCQTSIIEHLKVVSELARGLGAKVLPCLGGTPRKSVSTSSAEQARPYPRMDVCSDSRRIPQNTNAIS